MRRLSSLYLVAFALASAPALSLGDEPAASEELSETGERYDTSWGTGLLREEGGGQSAAIVRLGEEPIDEAALVFPNDLPPVVFASLRTRDQTGPTEGPFEFDPESGALSLPLPADADARSRVLGVGFACAEQAGQSRHGVVILPAQVATVRGETAKLESNGSNVRIGFWTNPKDEVVWSYDATRWGRYAVWLVYSTEAPDGAIAEVEVAGEKLDVELPSTGSWYRYRRLHAGDVYVAKEGKTEIVVRAEKLSGVALMNLKAVILEPTFESPERPKQAEDGSITLRAADAKVSGVKLRYEPKPEKNTLGYWTQVSDSASWLFRVERPGTYDVEVLQGCGEGQGGSSVSLLFAGGAWDELGFVVEDTGHFQNFVPRVVGQMHFREGGETKLTVKPTKIAKAAACDIRQIRLIPVAPAKP